MPMLMIKKFKDLIVTSQDAKPPAIRRPPAVENSLDFQALSLPDQPDGPFSVKAIRSADDRRIRHD